MRGLPRLALVALSVSCTRASVALAPAAPDPSPPALPAPAEPEPPQVQLSPDAVAEDLGDGFDVQLRCAPSFCDGAPWLAVEFKNPGSNTLVLEAPDDPDTSRVWTTARVAGGWEDSSGFLLGASISSCHATHQGTCWAGEPMLVAAGTTESFEIQGQAAQALDLILDVQIPWRQSATLAAGDAQEVRRGWRIEARPSGPRTNACVPMDCTITEVPTEKPEDQGQAATSPRSVRGPTHRSDQRSP